MKIVVVFSPSTLLECCHHAHGREHVDIEGSLPKSLRPATMMKVQDISFEATSSGTPKHASLHSTLHSTMQLRENRNHLVQRHPWRYCCSSYSVYPDGPEPAQHDAVVSSKEMRKPCLSLFWAGIRHNAMSASTVGFFHPPDLGMLLGSMT
jgi:hypothetical protein